MAPHSSTLALKIPWAEEPGRLAVHAVAKSRTRLTDFTSTFHFHALETEMATHSSVLAWRIPGTGEPGGLPSVGLHRVGHDWSDLASAAAELPSDWIKGGSSRTQCDIAAAGPFWDRKEKRELGQRVRNWVLFPDSKSLPKKRIRTRKGF